MIKHGMTTGRPIIIDDSIAKSCFDIAGICGGQVEINTDDIVMQIRKAGTCDPLIEYPVFDITEDKLCFYWDNLMYELPEGRYIGDLFFGMAKVGEVQFARSLTVNIGSVTHTERKRSVDCD